MEAREFKLKLVSAAFLHGDQGEPKKARVRTTAFDAGARYWFRAGVGAGTSSGKGLRELEGIVFGSTRHGRRVSFFASPSMPSVQSRKTLPQTSFKSACCALIPPLEVVLQVRIEGFSDREARADAVEAAVVLSQLLGGVGGRARRGAGSFHLVALPGPPYRAIEADDVNGFADRLDEEVSCALSRLREAQRSLGFPPSRFSDVPPPYPCFTNETRIVVVDLRTRDEQTARKHVMERLRPYRDPVFGLPHKSKGQPRCLNRKRHASPLHVHLDRLRDGSLVAVYTALLSKPILDLAKEHADPRRLHEFLDEEKKQGVELSRFRQVL